MGKINTELKLARITVFSPKIEQSRGKGPECSGLPLGKLTLSWVFTGLELVRKDSGARGTEGQISLASCAG